MLILVNKYFQLCSSKILCLKFRESFFINIDKEFKDLLNYDEGSYFIAVQINHRIPKNHGTNIWVNTGGSFRFWGSWNNNSAINHSMFMPHPSKFIRKIINFQQGKFLERLNYSSLAKKIYHYGPFAKEILIKDYGDYSGIKKLEPGFTIFLDENDSVKTTMHHSQPFSRIIRQKKEHNFIKHVIPIPPYEDLDIEMFFGECCSNNSLFKVQIWQYKNKHEVENLYEREILITNLKNAINLSDIFNEYKSNIWGGWVTFSPISGKHDKNYINHIYKSRSKKILFDAVHSHNYSSKKQFGRTLKFCPFKVSNNNKNIDKFDTVVAIVGNKNENVQIRLRIFDITNKNYEIIKHFNLQKSIVKFLDLREILDENKLNLDINFKIPNDFDMNGICQIECDQANLNSNFYIVRKNYDSIKSIAVDHMTGG